jgi:hypothetical protein
MSSNMIDVMSTVLDRLANGESFNDVVEDTGISALVSSAKAGAASGESRWADACNRQGWDDASQMIHLEGFIRDAGLMGAFADYAEAAVDEEIADTLTAEYVARIAASDIDEDALDDLVHEIVASEAADQVNAIDVPDNQESALDQAGQRAADINNAGFEAQVRYVLSMGAESSLGKLLPPTAEAVCGPKA